MFALKYRRMAIEQESPEQLGYGKIRHNLTETSVRDRNLKDLGLVLEDLLLPYGDHLGDPRLRELLALQSGMPHPDRVLVTPGAAGALFLVATALLEPGDHMVVARPNYGTNIETPRAIGADISFLDQTFEEGYRVDLDRLASLIRPDTKLVSLTCPHNPTGTQMTAGELRQAVELVERRGTRLLVDETYRDMYKDEPLPVAATLSDRVISVSSLSKTYGLPGIRIGWAVCRDEALMDLLLCAKEQVFIGGSVVDEHIAFVALSQKESWIRENDRTLAERFRVVTEWMEGEDLLEWVPPRGACTCFPRVRPEVDLDVEAFYRILNETYGTYVGPGHWFEQDRRHMRLGYGWPLDRELRDGLDTLSRSLREALR